MFLLSTAALNDMASSSKKMKIMEDIESNHSEDDDMNEESSQEARFRTVQPYQ